MKNREYYVGEISLADPITSEATVTYEREYNVAQAFKGFGLHHCMDASSNQSPHSSVLVRISITHGTVQ